MRLPTFAIRDLEQAAKRLPEGEAKQQLLREIESLREAQTALRRVRFAINRLAPPKAFL